LGLVAVKLIGCSDGDKAAPAGTQSEPTSPEPPTPVETVETKEEKNARMEARYSQGEKDKQDSAQAERTAHAPIAFSQLNFSWTTAPSFRKAGGKAVLDLDAKNYVPTSGMNADRYKTPGFTAGGQVALAKSATLEKIEQAYAKNDWLALVNLGGGTKYTSLPSVSRIDKAVKTLGLGIGLRVGRDPYQLHIYYPGPKRALSYLAINESREFRCRAIGHGRGATFGKIIQIPDTCKRRSNSAARGGRKVRRLVDLRIHR
jgi:hypothetical protein